MTTATAETGAVRALTRDDLAAVTAVDAAINGHSRLSYLQRRLAAAVREPALHAQFGIADEQELVAFVLARVLEGEFGQTRPALRLEVIAVRPEAQGRGLGSRLVDTLAAWARRHGIDELHTQAAWTEHAMLRWLDAQGFTIAPRHIVECTVANVSDAPAPEGSVEETAERRYDDGGRDYAVLARDAADVRSMSETDLDEIVRIDRHITGRDRRTYIEHKLAEAMLDSGVRVSLTARLDNAVVGYVMARADYGDYGRPEPVAVLDTIGVDPGFNHRGAGHALVAQLCANLAALRIDRLETNVGLRELSLLGFLYDAGFTPAQRLPFVRRLS